MNEETQPNTAPEPVGAIEHAEIDEADLDDVAGGTVRILPIVVSGGHVTPPSIRPVL